MKCIGSVLLAASVASWAGAVAAQSQDDWDGDFDAEPAERRSDVTFGGALGGVLGTGFGYPNEVAKIDNPAFEANTGAAVGLGYKIWLGGALADWVNFGIGFGSQRYEGDGPQVTTQQFLFRIETYPAFYEGGLFRDLGFHADLGIGGAKFIEKGDEVATGGSTSIITLGSFFEPLEFGRFRAGPLAEYQHSFSSTMSAHVGMVGFRLAFYGGPSAPEPRPAAPPATPGYPPPASPYGPPVGAPPAAPAGPQAR